jgi:hypothetical protein
MPWSCSSIGTVMNSSTSSDELPSAIVWISTCGGANSGKTSTFVFGIWVTPKTSNAVAANSTSQRNRRLLETIQRITGDPPGALMARYFEFSAVHLGRPDGDDLRAGRRAVGHDHALPFHAPDLHRRT